MRTSALGRTLAGVLILILVSPSPAAAEPAVTRDQVFAALGVDRVPADYVVLVDTSGSMAENDRYGDVRSVLTPFLRGLSASDRIAVYTFDNRPALRYQGDAARPAAVVAALPDGPTPGGRTDIGAAIDAGLGVLERDGAAGVATIVMITDGKHEPPPGSGYATLGSGAWKELRDRAGALTGTVNAYALPIGARDGAELLGQVVQGTTILDARLVRDLGGYLDRAKQQTRLSKARTALGTDPGRGVTVRWDDVPSGVDLTVGTRTVRATLTSATARLPLTVTGLAARTSYGEITARPAVTEVKLPPGGSATIDVELAWNPSADLLPIGRTREEAVDLTLTGTVASPWAAPLRQSIDLATPALPDTAARTTATARTGWPWVLPALVAGFALALLILWLTIYRRRNPYMPGAVSVRTPDSGAELARFPLQRRRPVELRSSAMPGSGLIRGHRRAADRGAVEVTYSPDGSERRRTRTVLRPREPLMVGGLTFLHQPDENPEERL